MHGPAQHPAHPTCLNDILPFCLLTCCYVALSLLQSLPLPPCPASCAVCITPPLQLLSREAALSEAEGVLKQQSQHMEAAAQLTQREAEVRGTHGERQGGKTRKG